jgi:molybdopterin-synthase adenylyltransferase
MNLERYSRQIAFERIGSSGQNALKASTIGIIGCGALGTNMLDSIARSGVGKIIISDNDIVELSNLQRQKLFSEIDIGTSKSKTAERIVKNINSQVEVKSFNLRVNKENFYNIYGNCDLLLDATDNFETRFMINEECLLHNIPWIFSGITSSSGQSAFIYPPKTSCLKCFLNSDTIPETLPNTVRNGIISTIASAISSISVTKAIKYLITKEIDQEIIYLDIWTFDFKKFFIPSNPRCGICSSLHKGRKTK